MPVFLGAPGPESAGRTAADLTTGAGRSGAAPGPRPSGATLVWNKGIAALCDWRIPDEFSSPAGYTPVPLLAGAAPGWRTPARLIEDPSAYAGVADGEVIWLRLAWMKAFVRQVLPLIRARFVLVTADSDAPVPGSVRRHARVLTNDGRLVHWYAQNYDGSDRSGRISPLPIGIDFHTLAERPYWGEPVAPPGAQQRALLSIRDALPPLAQRIPAVYVDFGWQRTRLGGRRGLIRQLSGHPSVVVQPAPLSRSEMWRQRGEYAFVLSPPGNGLDTHRMWEALALGHIVLTPESALDPLCRGLRVMRFRHPSEIRQESLERAMEEYGPAEAGGAEKLSSAHWMAIIRSGRPVI